MVIICSVKGIVVSNEFIHSGQCVDGGFVALLAVPASVGGSARSSVPGRCRAAVWLHGSVDVQTTLRRGWGEGCSVTVLFIEAEISAHGNTRLTAAHNYFTTVSGYPFLSIWNILDGKEDSMLPFIIHPIYNEVCHQYLGPDTDIEMILLRADVWLMRVDFIFEFPRPTMPNIVYIGGFQCKPSKPLAAEFEEFVQSSGEHGIIVMSLGTIVSSLSMQITMKIAEAFAQVPQKVIWRYDGKIPPNIGNNTLLAKWIPQNDLLGHPKTQAFISHGGTNGVYEAIYHGVPVVGIPLFFDQFDNMLRLETRGAAKVINIATLQSSDLLQTINEVINNASYRDNMQKLSALHRDQPESPMERAIFWIEYVARHKGAAHLRSESYRLPWYVYHCVDVIFFLLSLFLIVTMLTVLLLKKVYNAARRKKEKIQ
ncbi:hypothetical protein scyTo_0018171 [Scyliorhinus torazame]|uniref:UDP-glucuronosyltransferase n=1 Tax=Scyliorhinus torazame TaxID=75743 RepID=A0A401PPL0_SCYTO|nr:hypothetical protein [Scyliorhinus torazame]